MGILPLTLLLTNMPRMPKMLLATDYGEAEMDCLENQIHLIVRQKISGGGCTKLEE